MTTDPLCATCGHASEQHVLDRISFGTLLNGHEALRWRFMCGGTPTLGLGCVCSSFKLSAEQVAEMQPPSSIEGV